MKKILLLLLVLDVIGFITGILYIQLTKFEGRGHLLIGLSISMLMFVIVPVFLFMRYSKKQAGDFVYKNEEEKNE